MQVRNRDLVKSPYRNSLVCGLDLVKTLGWRSGLYVGFTATVSREIPQYVCYFYTYGRVKSFLEDKQLCSSNISPIFAGGCAGAMIWVPPLYSIDVIKTRLQSSPVGTYNGFIDCAAKSYKAEGLSFMTRGVSLALTRAFLVHGSIFFSYELCMSLFKGGEDKSIESGEANTEFKRRNSIILN